MIKPIIKVIGHDKVAKEMLNRVDQKSFDELAENTMKKIQLDSFRKAPVLTGFLSSNLVANENRKRTDGVPLGSWDLIDGTDYTLVQEFEHMSKSGFIRTSVWDAEPRFKKEVKKLAKKGK